MPEIVVWFAEYVASLESVINEFSKDKVTLVVQVHAF